MSARSFVYPPICERVPDLKSFINNVLPAGGGFCEHLKAAFFLAASAHLIDRRIFALMVSKNAKNQDEDNEKALKDLTNAKLREKLRDMGLKKSGKKSELVARIKRHQSQDNDGQTQISRSVPFNRAKNRAAQHLKVPPRCLAEGEHTGKFWKFEVQR